MNCYRFEVHQKLVTHIEVQADSEPKARERIFKQDEHVTAFDTIYGDTKVVLRSVDGD